MRHICPVRRTCGATTRRNSTPSGGWTGPRGAAARPWGYTRICTSLVLFVWKSEKLTEVAYYFSLPPYPTLHLWLAPRGQADVRRRRAGVHRLALRVSILYTRSLPSPSPPRLPVSPRSSPPSFSPIAYPTDTYAVTRRIYELQAFLTELVSNFQFEPTEGGARVRKTTAIVMIPTVEGEVHMPLRVSLAPPDED